MAVVEKAPALPSEAASCLSCCCDDPAVAGHLKRSSPLTELGSTMYTVTYV